MGRRRVSGGGYSVVAVAHGSCSHCWASLSDFVNFGTHTLVETGAPEDSTHGFSSFGFESRLLGLNLQL